MKIIVTNLLFDAMKINTDKKNIYLAVLKGISF